VPGGTTGQREVEVEGGEDGRRRGWGTSERGGGKAKNRRPQLETLKPRRHMNLGEGPTAPMPMPMRGGQRGGVNRDEKGLHA